MTLDEATKKADERRQRQAKAAEKKATLARQNIDAIKASISGMTDEELVDMWSRVQAGPSTAGRALGSVKTARKASASRENGRKGGRPRKTQS